MAYNLQERLDYLYSESEADPDDISKKVASVAIEATELGQAFNGILRIPRYARLAGELVGMRESDVGHSFSLSMMAPAVARQFYPGLDAYKITDFAIVHDMLELEVGDVATFDLNQAELEEKERREKEAIPVVKARLLRVGPHWAEAFEEYERQDCVEARFTRFMDKFMPVAVDITGDGLTVMREDYGIDSLEKLKENHENLYIRIKAKFGGEFPELMAPYAKLLAEFEEKFRVHMVESDGVLKPRETIRGPVETERKFYVKSLPEGLDLSKTPRKLIRQAYVAIGGDGSETRIRSSDGERFELTIKSSGTIQRGEQTLELTEEMFSALSNQIVGEFIEKTRYVIPYGDREIELDIYGGRLEGLMTAEVEFPGRPEDAMVKSTSFIPPEWFGREVSNDSAYKNRQLALHGMPQPTLHLGGKQF